MSFLARLVSDNSGSLEKLELETPSSPDTLRKQFLQGIRVLVRGYLHVRFDLLSSINFRDISGSPNLGPITQKILSVTIGFYGSDYSSH